MNLSQKIAAALDDVGTNVASPTTVSVDDGLARVSLALELTSPVGVRCHNMEMTIPASEPRSLANLREWANRFVAKATYLMEPLAVVEADASAGEVLVRSNGPTSRGGRRAFYEARFTSSGDFRLSRVSFDEVTRRRDPEAFSLTREALERVVDDLVTTAS
jgi:hypothetical protein